MAKKTKIPTPPPTVEPIQPVQGNLNKSENDKIVTLNFKVTAEFKRDFKTFAAVNDISMRKLLEYCFDAYKRNR